MLLDLTAGRETKYRHVFIFFLKGWLSKITIHYLIQYISHIRPALTDFLNSDILSPPPKLLW